MLTDLRVSSSPGLSEAAPHHSGRVSRKWARLGSLSTKSRRFKGRGLRTEKTATNRRKPPSAYHLIHMHPWPFKTGFRKVKARVSNIHHILLLTVNCLELPSCHAAKLLRSSLHPWLIPLWLSSQSITVSKLVCRFHLFGKDVNYTRLMWYSIIL